jgi:four helix bundle protein
MQNVKIKMSLKNSKSKAQMSNKAQNPNNKKKNKYDLGERTAKFGKDIIRLDCAFKSIEFAKSLPDTPVNRSLISQIIRSSTSIGANYMEADCAESKKDFRHKIGLCKKESKETTHWLRMLRMIAKANSTSKIKCREFWQEAHEFTLIFSSILNKNKK